MADNIELDTPGTPSGKSVRTDDDGTAHWQYVKLAYGADNTQTIVTSTTTNPLPVALSDTDNAVLDSIDTAVNGTITVSGTSTVSGVAAENAAVSGNPVLTGGRYDASDRTLGDGDVGALALDSVGRVKAKITNDNLVSTNNSTSTPLGISGVFTGTSDDISSYSAVTIQIYSDKASATDGLSIEFSTDGTNWDEKHTATIAAASERVFTFPTHAQYYRIVYTNGGTGQTVFRLQSILHAQPVPGSAHGMDENIAADDVGILTKSAIVAQAAGSGSFVPVQATAGGNFKVAVEEFDASLPAGTNNIGDVDVLTVPAPLSTTGGGTEATALRVTIANDSTGVLSIDDNGASITIDGTVTANAGTNLNTSALALESGGNLATVAGAVSGTEMQVDVVASLPAGTNAIGKLAANSGVDIGDVDVTSIAAGTNLIGDVGISGARTSGGTTLYRNVDVDETEDAIKASGGQLYWIHAMNLTASVLYLQFYNATVASVTVGTTTPDLTFPLPTQGDTNGAGFTLAIPNGIAFSTAITIACTTTIGGATGPAANGCVVNAGYA